MSANPIQINSTNPNGKYQFANLGPLAAGTSYVVAEVVPAATNQTAPSSSNNTIVMPDGSIGYIVPAISGVALDQNGRPAISGTGSYTFNSLADTVTGAINFNDGQGNSGNGIEAYISPFNVTFNNGVNAPVSFTSFCIDLTHEINVGGTYPVTVRTDEANANGNRMAYIEQTFGRGAISTNQAVAVQIALWDLSLNNHNPTSFKQDTDGSYSSGDESVFSVANLSTNPADTVQIVTLVNQFLAASTSVDPPGADLGTTGSGQTMTVPNQRQNFGNQGQLAPNTPTPGGKPGQMVRQNPNAATNGPNTTGPCPCTVIPKSGQLDPAVDVFDVGGQDPMSLVVSWINGNYSAGSNMGSHINNSLTPSVVQIGSTNTLAILIGSSDSLFSIGTARPTSSASAATIN